MEMEKERGEEERRRGGEAPRCAFLSAVPAIIYARFRAACMANGKRLFMRLCANAPAALIRGAFLPPL